jgi:hypothetical protein
MKNIITSLILLLLFSASPSFSQSAPVNDPLLDHMVGRWTLTGSIDKQATTHDVEVKWVLNRQYLQFNETSREKDAAGNPSYEAVVFITWIEKQQQYSCLWLDNTGNTGLTGQAVGHAPREANDIRFLFKVSDNDAFHTTFSYDQGSDSWKLNMDNELNGKTEPFARLKLIRIKN